MLPLNKSQIPDLFRKARAAEVAGDPKQAQAGYKAILRLDRTYAPAHFQLGQIHYRQKDLNRAIQSFEKAASSRPGEPAIWQLYARAVADLKDPAATQAFLNKAKKARLDRKLLLALQNMFTKQSGKTRTSIGNAPAQDVKRAIEFLQTGHEAEAVKVAKKLRKAHPKVAIIADILANAQAATGQFEEAEKNFRAAMRLDPDYAETHSNFGRFLVERERYDEAVEELQTALKLAPKLVSAMVHLGVAFKRMNNNRAAIIAFQRALSVEQDNREASLELGQVLVTEQRGDEALPVLERALELGADETDSRIAIARAMFALDRGDEALALLDRAWQDDPHEVEILFAKASILQALGQFDDARATFREAIKIQPKAGRIYRVFMASEKLDADDPLISQMEQGFADPDINDEARINFGFALAKVYEDTKQYDRVFTYLKPANDLMRQLYPFDFNVLRAQSQAVMDSLRDVDFPAVNIKGRTEYAPIFVTGLPRSGTTLVEQIVSSHSSVTGGGELGNARSAWSDLLIESSGSVRPWSAITDAQIVKVGHTVEAQMRKRFGDAMRVTDKSVQSYSMIGPIRASMPNARFVVVKRDPRDNLLSMYKNMFVMGKHLHSYSLRDLARYYRLFEEIIAYWQTKVPDWVHVVQYEDLIADPETQARAVIAACDLEWEDQCLSFYENKRRVDTLSVHQVRQPIYSSSMQAWRRYEGELTEMLEELGGEYAPEA